MAEPILRVKQGTLKGKVNTTPNGTPYYSFSGIPYAKPPVGDLRFKYPEPAEAWDGVRDATEQGAHCPQYHIFTREVSGSDDCLFVNVHTPLNVTSGAVALLLPVLVMIHGGGFSQGSGGVEGFGPEYLLEAGGFVYASINYRVGVIGFLNAPGDGAARGDMGLMDQNLALRWIKDNVEPFGGDPERITLIGESAGSASIEYHLLSPLSSGLFSAAILQSGSVFNPWARDSNPMARTRLLARNLGYGVDRPDEGLFAFLGEFDSQTLVTASMSAVDVEGAMAGKCFAFIPSVNHHHKDGKGFLDEEPEVLMREGRFNDVPVLAGHVDKEGIFAQAAFRPFLRNCTVEEVAQFICPYKKANVKSGDALRRLNQVYAKRHDDPNTYGNLVDMISDLFIMGGVWHSLARRLRHTREKQYFYNFVHTGNLFFAPFEWPSGERLKGASHVDDLLYMASMRGYDAEPSDEDVRVRSLMVEMVTNFVKTHDPTPTSTPSITWPPVTNEDFCYLEWGGDFRLICNGFKERRALWFEMYGDS